MAVLERGQTNHSLSKSSFKNGDNWYIDNRSVFYIESYEGVHIV